MGGGYCLVCAGRRYGTQGKPGRKTAKRAEWWARRCAAWEKWRRAQERAYRRHERRHEQQEEGDRERRRSRRRRRRRQDDDDDEDDVIAFVDTPGPLIEEIAPDEEVASDEEAAAQATAPASLLPIPQPKKRPRLALDQFPQNCAAPKPKTKLTKRQPRKS